MAVALNVPATSRVYNGVFVLMPTRPADVMRIRSNPVYVVFPRSTPTFAVLNVMHDGMLDAFENGASDNAVMLLLKKTFASVPSVWFPPNAIRPRYMFDWMMLLGYTRARAV